MKTLFFILGFCSLLDAESFTWENLHRQCKHKPQTRYGFESRPEYFDFMQKSLSSLTENDVESAFFVYLNCTDGASALALKQWLGVEVLINHPKKFILALSKQRKAEALGREMARMENDEFFATECSTPDCIQKKKAFYQIKYDKLKNLKPQTPLMGALMEEIRNAHR